jgi:hypothetical protein
MDSCSAEYGPVVASSEGDDELTCCTKVRQFLDCLCDQCLFRKDFAVLSSNIYSYILL